jgi:hypothetical protein
MKTKILLVIAFFLTGTVVVFSQNKIVDKNNNIWLSNINDYKINAKLSLSSELHIRRTEWLESWQQFLFRPAINYSVKPDVILTAGYTYITSNPYGKQALAVTTPENNFWEQVTLNHGVGKLKISHRYRLEHRFIGKTIFNGEGYEIKGTNYAQRFRYRATFALPLNEKFSAEAFNEVWIVLADNFMPLALNQNWLYAGLKYKVNENTSVGLGYMNQLIKKGDGIHYESNPTIQFALFLKLF